MAGASAQVDSSVINRQITELAKRSSKTFADIANQRGLNVAGRAMNHTVRADKARIVRELGETGRNLRVSKTGKLVRGTRIFVQAFGSSNAPRAALIINARRARAGLPGLEGAPMEKAIVKMLGGRKRGVGFEAVSWLSAQRILASKLSRPFKIGRTAGLAIYGRSKGSAIPAAPGLTTGSTIVNNAKEIQKVGTAALQQGINEESAEITSHLIERDLKADFEKFNAQGK